jgi:hypothetical protein
MSRAEVRERRLAGWLEPLKIGVAPRRISRRRVGALLSQRLQVCGIRCSRGGTPPSVRITRYFAPCLRCCRISRWATLLYQLRAASLEGNSHTVTPATGPCPSRIRARLWSIKTRAE